MQIGWENLAGIKMTGADLRAALSELGWSQGDLAVRLGIHRNAVTEWAQGRRAVPKYAAEYLRVMRLVNEIWSG